MDSTLGFAAVLAAQMAGCFALGWWLCRHIGAEDVRRPGAPLATLETIAFLNHLVYKMGAATEQHTAILSECSDEIRSLAIPSDQRVAQPLAAVMSQILSANSQLRGEVTSLTKTLSDLGKRAAVRDDNENCNEQSELLGQSTNDPLKEEVEENRTPFEGSVLVAPYHVGRAITENFRAVECRDISPTGFSFWAHEPLHHKRISVRLGDPADPIDMIAEVIETAEAGNGAEHRYAIDCQFVRRSSRIDAASEEAVR